MIERARGVILRTRPLTETSLIVHWLTPECGRVSTVARGARRPKSPFRGKLDLFYEADLTFTRSRRSDLHTLNEVLLRATHEPLRHEVDYLRQAVYCSMLVMQTTETDTPLPAVFELMRGFLDALPQAPARPMTVFSFELRLLGELGLAPDLETSRLSPGTRQVMEKLRLLDWPLLARLKMSDQQVRELQQFLQGFLIYHCERLPHGRNAALNQSSAHLVSREPDKK